MFGSIFRFEVNYHRRQFLFYILCSVFFLLTFLSTTSDNVSIGPTFSNVNINAPIAVISSLATLSILSLFGAVAFVANGVVRDYDLKTAETAGQYIIEREVRGGLGAGGAVMMSVMANSQIRGGFAEEICVRAFGAEPQSLMRQVED